MPITVSPLKFFLGIFVAVNAVAQEVRLPEISVGTNRFEAVTVKKLNAADALIKFKSGLTVVKIKDLPEPIRSEWLNEVDLIEFEKQQKDAAALQKYREKVNAARSRHQALFGNSRKVNGKMVPVSEFKTITGTVKELFEDGVLIRRFEKKVSYITVRDETDSLGRIGAYRAHGLNRRIYSTETVDKGFAFVKNATFEQVKSGSFKAMKVGQRTVHGVLAEIYDCGEIPKFIPPPFEGE